MSSEIRIDASAPTLVALADLAVSHDPTLTLCSHPLGACMGVVIYDPSVKVGGMLHALLPASSIDPLRAATRPGMFLDTGVNALLTRAQKLGAKLENIRVYIAGGAQIMDDSGHFNIGKRNHEVLVDILKGLGLKIEAEDVGGRANRTMQLDMANGDVRLKYSGQSKVKTLCKP